MGPEPVTKRGGLRSDVTEGRSAGCRDRAQLLAELRAFRDKEGKPHAPPEEIRDILRRLEAEEQVPRKDIAKLIRYFQNEGARQLAIEAIGRVAIRKLADMARQKRESTTPTAEKPAE